VAPPTVISLILAPALPWENRTWWWLRIKDPPKVSGDTVAISTRTTTTGCALGCRRVQWLNECVALIFENGPYDRSTTYRNDYDPHPFRLSSPLGSLAFWRL
jgi:hypothetical protein